MTRIGLMVAAVAAVGGAMAAEPAATAFVSVDLSREIGAIKPMHAVNNGPTVPKARVNDQKRGNFIEYRAARLPFARTHDSINCVAGGAHTCDVNAVFPNFDADENDPKNYDFAYTDKFLETIIAAANVAPNASATAPNRTSFLAMFIANPCFTTRRRFRRRAAGRGSSGGYYITVMLFPQGWRRTTPLPVPAQAELTPSPERTGGARCHRR